MELVHTESALREAENRLTNFKKEVAKKEVEWDEEKLQLQKGCVEVHEEGFMKVMR